jgi:hypothetical protein
VSKRDVSYWHKADLPRQSAIWGKADISHNASAF